MEHEMAINTNGLTKRYGNQVAVDSLNLSIWKGEIYGFLGANGAGKTTTLRMLLGLIKPTSGTVKVMDHDPGSEEGIMQIGSMIETPSFYPHLSGRDNLRVLAKMCGIDRGRVNQVLDQVDLLNRADDSFRAYSLGMKQRLGVAAAMLKNPPLLVLDEPTNGLDPAGMADMRTLIRRLGDEGKTVIISSHIMSEVEQIVDRVGIISRGKLITERPINDLRGNDTLVIDADPIEDVRTLVTHLPGVKSIEQRGSRIHIETTFNHALNAGQLNTRLVRAGIEVREMRWDRPSLESVFLTLTNQSTEPLTEVAA